MTLRELCCPELVLAAAIQFVHEQLTCTGWTLDCSVRMSQVCGLWPDSAHNYLSAALPATALSSSSKNSPNFNRLSQGFAGFIWQTHLGRCLMTPNLNCHRLALFGVDLGRCRTMRSHVVLHSKYSKILLTSWIIIPSLKTLKVC